MRNGCVPTLMEGHLHKIEGTVFLLVSAVEFCALLPLSYKSILVGWSYFVLLLHDDLL